MMRKRTRTATSSERRASADGADAEISLRGRVWPRFLSAPDPQLVRDLYEPALSVAVRYDRCCSYFSSSVLAAAARGFGPFIERLLAMDAGAPRPAIRLLVNEELQEADVRALLERGDHSALERLLLERLGSARTALEQHRLEMLAWLYAKGLLDIKVGIMRQSLGLLHAKFGIITDAAGDALVFAGSGNESASGLRGNYEQIEISGSWADLERERHYRDEFERLWAGTHADVTTVELPDAIRDHVVRMAPPEPPAREEPLHRETLEAAMRWQFIAEAPYLVGASGAAACDATAFVSPWPHQRRVVDETVAAWPEGRLLCDEVGMGKTIEAILILRRLLHGRGVRRALLLLPAGLMRQWQDELREKGALVVPRYEGGKLQWPDGRVEDVAGLADALTRDLLIVSRELARLPTHHEAILAAPAWDLVLLDESHAARRARQEETEFNRGTLLLDLLRSLQLDRKTRSLLLLSATPMQTHPWEPFDLLQVLGEGGEWLADFDGIRAYYGASGALLRGARCHDEAAQAVARLVAADGRYCAPPVQKAVDQRNPEALATTLSWSLEDERPELGNWLRREAPLTRRMHRNTRATLCEYHRLGLICEEPPERHVRDERFDYATTAEREVYQAVEAYIERRFQELERERAGKGFVMSIYRRRTSSSPLAIKRSLERRRQGLRQVIARAPTEDSLGADEVVERDLDEYDDATDQQAVQMRVSLALPDDPQTAANELQDVESLLALLNELGTTDSKRDMFLRVHDEITADGRPVLVFTEAADTMEYVRDAMLPLYGRRLATFSGDGGRRWNDGGWETVSKQTVTDLLSEGELQAVVCTDAASEGLNLQAAGALINYDLPWNPSRVEQRIGRIDRIDQRYRRLYVVNLLLADSVDDRVYQVLQERCGLFRYFVGAMQPVLSEARRVLLGRGGSVDSLRTTADNVAQDYLSGAVYQVEDAVALPQQRPAIHARDIFDALTSTRVCDVSVHRVSETIVQVEHGARIVRYAIGARELDNDVRLEPLSPTADVVIDLARSLHPEAPLLPLVVGSRHEGAFRSSSALWVHRDGRAEAINDYRRLDELLGAWDGYTPSRERLEESRMAANDAAAKAVREASARAAAAEQRGLDAQVLAARGRLMREVCRYLLVRHSSLLPPDASWLSQAFYQETVRAGAVAARFLRAYELLGGYPQWDPYVTDQMAEVVARYGQARRGAVLSATSIDAALADPRWRAMRRIGGQEVSV